MDEPAGHRIPSPYRVGDQVRPAHPAVDAQQRDTVGLACEHVLAAAGQPERQAGENVRIAERRGSREWLARLRLDEAGVAGAQDRERAEKPGVAEERRRLEVLRRDEGCPPGIRAGSGSRPRRS